MARPPTQYTNAGDVSIAYQVVGDGPIDLVYAQGWLTNASEWWGAYIRNSASPKTAELITRLNAQVDMRNILPTISSPTLIINRENDAWGVTDEARYIASLIPNSTLKIVPGADHLPWYGDQDRMVGEIQEFLTGQRDTTSSERVLLTVLMTDIGGSTKKAAALGDSRWRAILDQHDEIVRRRVSGFGDQTINTTGDGFITTFMGPTRAIQCAEEIRADVSRLDMEIKSGVHTGECERRGSDIGGLAVHIAARILDHASPGQVLVSGTVKDLTIGSGLEFQPAGTQSLKGVPGEWPLYAMVS